MAAKRQSNARTGTCTLFGRAAIYARISLDKVGEAAGVGRQIDAYRHLADLEGWSVDEVLVDEVLGFRRFTDPEFQPEPPPTLVRCERYLAGAFRRGQESWPVLSLKSLVESPSFLQAAS